MELHLLTRATSFALVAALCSCTERVDISTRQAEPHLVIYGHLTNEPGERNGVDITRSGDYFSDRKPEPIRDATVTISDGQRSYIFEEHPNQPGFYIPGADGPYVAQGVEYTLEVELDFHGTGQRTRYGARTLTPRSAVLDRVELEERTLLGQEAVAVLLSARLPVSGAGYYSTHLWVDNGSVDGVTSRMNLFRGEDIAGRTLDRVPFYWLDQGDERSHLEPGDRVTASVDAITAGYYDFMNYAQSEAGASIPFFSGPPANLPTNIERLTPGDLTPVAGYFTSLLRSSYDAYWTVPEEPYEEQ